MKKIFILLIAAAIFLVGNDLSAQKVFRSLATGNWNAYTTWEISTAGSAGPFTSAPSGTSGGTNYPDKTCDVIIQSPHVVTLNNTYTFKNLTINSGGTLQSDGTARTLRPYGATGPVTITNNGMFGGTTTGPDAIVLEAYTDPTSYGFTITGTGTTRINRIRTLGAATNALTVVIDQNIFLTQTANYALTAVYNPSVNDNYTITINEGKTVKTTAANGYFHNSQNATTYGQYTYNIKGTLDLSSNTQTTNNLSGNIIAPAPEASKITVNVDGGTLKLGAGFKADTSNNSPQSTGVLEFKVVNSGTIDATNTSTFRMGKTSDGTGGFRPLVFAMDASSSLKQTVGATSVRFPVGVNGTANNSVSITNAGTPDDFSVSVKSTIDNAPLDPNKVVNRQWTITEGTPGGSDATVSLSWIADDRASGFDPDGTVVIGHWNGTKYETFPATVTGSGAASDPYVATASGITSFSPFVVGNLSALPLTFVSANAYQKNNDIKIDWSTAQESNVDKFAIEKSTNGTSFATLGFVAAAGNTSSKTNYSYVDAAPSNGNNFYRIKAIDKDGKANYTSILKVTIANGSSSVVIAPNPVKGKQLNIQFVNGVKGIYDASLYNAGGQKVFSSKINSEGGSSIQTIALPSSIKAGAYNLILSNGDIKINKGIIVE